PSQNDWYGGWAKRMGELQIEAYRQEYGWQNLDIVRPTNIYGPWDNFHGDHAMVVPSLIRKAFSAEDEMTVWGSGRPARDFLYSEDAARGILLVAQQNPGKPINLGSGQPRSIKDLLEIVKNEVNPNLKIIWDSTKPDGDALRCMDTERASSLNIEAQHTLEEGVAKTIEWYKKQ
ncbi:MAG: NAD-dependent epimerase/dehydratase family protein, partial [Alphaproteobacteria bacterium]|nr:NAD-dependent epimerase/dehydratase family protein [Alphaproteobacteria bacterium]